MYILSILSFAPRVPESQTSHHHHPYPSASPFASAGGWPVACLPPESTCRIHPTSQVGGGCWVVVVTGTLRRLIRFRADQAATCKQAVAVTADCRVEYLGEVLAPNLPAQLTRMPRCLSPGVGGEQRT